MAATVETIIGAVFEETHWNRAALQRAVTGLGLSWPEVEQAL